jgi:hypothetical protein
LILAVFVLSSQSLACGPVTPYCAYAAWQYFFGGTVIVLGGAFVAQQATVSKGNNVVPLRISNARNTTEDEPFYLVLESAFDDIDPIDNIALLNRTLREQGFEGVFELQMIDTASMMI